MSFPATAPEITVGTKPTPAGGRRLSSARPLQSSPPLPASVLKQGGYLKKRGGPLADEGVCLSPGIKGVEGTSA